jgi:uncharacterized membrane protein (UPF0127 family)
MPTLLSTPEQKVLIANLWVAQNPWTRMKGLLGKSSLNPDQGLLLIPCNQIHMYFMQFPIEAVFLGTTADPWVFQILSIQPFLKPFTLLPKGNFKAKATLEVTPGFCQAHQLNQGDSLCLKW